MVNLQKPVFVITVINGCDGQNNAPPKDVQVLVIRLVAHVVLLAKGMRQM